MIRQFNLKLYAPILVIGMVVSAACVHEVLANEPDSNLPLTGIIVKDANGQPHKSLALKGKKFLLLTFFPKCFTFNCANQLQSLRDNYKELQKADVEVWGISTDPADGERGQRAFAKHLKLPFPLFPDTDRKISLAFGAVQSKEQMAIRMSILIDKDGKIAWVDKQIDPRNHGTDVLARLRKDGMLPPVSAVPVKEPQPNSK